MQQKVFDVVANVMEIPAEIVNMESSPDSIETWDSLRHMNLVLALEQEFGVQFSDEQVVELMNVEIIVAVLNELVSND